MEALEEEYGPIVEGYYYARCPHCCNLLIHGANGTDCFINCAQCGRDYHITIKDDTIRIELKQNQN